MTTGLAGFDLAAALRDAIAPDVTDIDLASALPEAIRLHEERRCRFRKGAAERLTATPEFAAFAARLKQARTVEEAIASPEFAALAARLEKEESKCRLRSAA